MKVMQILPELNAGGVERGTLEVAAHLARHGHQALVVSAGGRMVESLEKSGARHIALPVHRKHPASLALIPALRRLFLDEKPDIIHLRSRLPAWLSWLAWKSLPADSRPHLVTTVHGFYSVNAYSAVMTRGEWVIAVSDSVRNYIVKNYPQTDPSRITVIHRGVDEMAYCPGFSPSDGWLAQWRSDFPQLNGRILLLMPGRLTRWKGQEDFIRLIAALHGGGLPVHGLIVGEPHPRKLPFLEELQQLAASLGISERISFLGHRSDIREIMTESALVYSLSRDPEAFGRVSLEALALGKPVIGYNHGGVAEQLLALFPEGLVPPGDIGCAVDRTRKILKGDHAKPKPISEFSLERMLAATTGIYQKFAARRP
jgi:glycosyltransferase involved in cell wall biosynthesis